MVSGALVLLVVHLGQTGSRENAASRLRMVQAVSHLQGCLTCHSTTFAATPVGVNQQTLSAAYHPRIQLLDKPVATPTVSLAGQVDRDLLTIGQRILDVHPANLPLSDVVVQKFLQIYDQAQAHPGSEPVLLDVIRQLGGLEQLLQMLENQASPYQLKKANTSTVQSAAAVVVPFTSPLALAVESPFTFDAAQHVGSVDNHYRISVPAPPVFAAYRRGPPALTGEESVLFGKKIAVQVDAQSSFLSS